MGRRGKRKIRYDPGQFLSWMRRRTMVVSQVDTGAGKESQFEGDEFRLGIFYW